MASLGDGVNHLLMEVSPDIHICGFCKQQYNNFELFLAHKQNGCQVSTNVSGFIAAATESIQSGFPVEEALQGCLSKVVKKTVKIQKTPSKKLKPGLAQKKHICSVLGCTFKTQYGQKDMERHMFTHTGERPFECELCHKCFSRRDKLNLHIRSHTGEKPHKCKHCTYAAADSSSLKKHLRVHFNERPFKCQICSYASRNSSQLTVHLRSHTGDAPFQCGECGAKFKINSDLKRHARVHSGEKPYSCNLCDYRCAMKANLKSHERLRHGTYSCTECEFRCAAKAALRAHSRQHAPAHPLRCACCPYSCTSKGALKRHERVHSDERPFACHHCPFASKQRANLLVHMRKSHSETLLGGRAKLSKGSRVEEESSNAAGSRYRIRLEAAQAYRCDLCDASFVREDSLRSHKRQHDNKQKLQSGESGQLRTRVEKKTEEAPRQVSLTITDSLVSSYGSTQLKIIVAPSLGRQGTFIQPTVDMPSSKAANVLLSTENVILNPIIQSVSLLTPVQHISQPVDGDIKHQTVLLTHVSANEESSLLQPSVSSPVSMETQNYLPSTSESSHAFITTCSDLDSLHALIQQGGTEVTVVSEGHHAVSTAATINSTLKQSTGAEHTPPQELPTHPCEVETADGSGLIVTDLDMEPTSSLLEHDLPLTIATQNHQSTIYQIPPNQIFLDANIQTTNEDSQ